MIDWINIQRLGGQCKRGELPSFVCDYLEHYSSQPSGSRNWKDLRILVFDTETTGLNIHRDRMLEIGAVGIQGGEILLKDTFELLIDAKKSPAEDSIQVHGLLPEEIRSKGLSEQEAIARFLGYIKGDGVVAHHINFDIGMIEMAMRRSGVERFFMFNKRIDTAELAKKLEHPRKPPSYIDHSKYGLDELCERYGISTEDRHRAWGDAMITAKLFLKLVQAFEEKGKNKLKDLIQ